MNLLAINIQSYSGGVSDAWAFAKKEAVVRKEKKQEKDKVQSFGDGLLEFISFYSIGAIGRERMIHGNAYKVCQGPGKFMISFKEGDTKKPIVTYFQVDGESMKITAPKYLAISKSKLVKNGKISVLVKQGSKYAKKK